MIWVSMDGAPCEDVGKQRSTGTQTPLSSCTKMYCICHHCYHHDIIHHHNLGKGANKVGGIKKTCTLCTAQVVINETFLYGSCCKYFYPLWFLLQRFFYFMVPVAEMLISLSLGSPGWVSTSVMSWEWNLGWQRERIYHKIKIHRIIETNVLKAEDLQIGTGFDLDPVKMKLIQGSKWTPLFIHLI